jgi:hypothetical protein
MAHDSYDGERENWSHPIGMIPMPSLAFRVWVPGGNQTREMIDSDVKVNVILPKTLLKFLLQKVMTLTSNDGIFQYFNGFDFSPTTFCGRLSAAR